MNLLRVLATSAMALSIVGCSIGSNYAVDPCDACSTGPVIGGGILRFFALPSPRTNCGQSGGCGLNGCEQCGYGGIPDGNNIFCNGMGPDSGCTCGRCPRQPRPRPLSNIFGRRACRKQCGHQPCDCGGMMMNGGCGGQCGGPMGGSCGMPSGCGCGQPSPMSHDMNSTTPNPLPGVPAPAPPASGPTTPAPETDQPSASNRAYSGMRSQTVSYEEFQRLPGTIVSGSGAMTSNSAVAMPRTNASSQLAAREPNLLPQPTAPVRNQQSLWVPVSN